MVCARIMANVQIGDNGAPAGSRQWVLPDSTMRILFMLQINDQREQKDASLRQDIHTLGDALGQAIRRHGGETVFATVERLRKSC